MRRSTMRDCGNGGAGNSGLGMADVAVGCAKSRAAARILAGRMPGERAAQGPKRFSFVHHGPRPRYGGEEFEGDHAGPDHLKPWASPWVRVRNGTLFRTVYIPGSISDEDARRWLAGITEE